MEKSTQHEPIVFIQTVAAWQIELHGHGIGMGITIGTGSGIGN